MIPLSESYKYDRHFRKVSGVYHYVGPLPWRARLAQCRAVLGRIFKWLNTPVEF